MTITLNLFDHLLGRGRKFQELGRVLDALRYLTRLAAIRELPPEIAEECQTRLGEIQLKRRRYRRARLHLAKVLQLTPNNARIYHLLGQAYLAEGRGDQKKASEHFQRALELDATLIPCMVDAGLLSIKLGQSQQGLDLLRRAGELAPDDWQVIGKLARGLRQTGKTEEARNVLRLAMFRNPRSLRFRKLWNDSQFQLVRQEQDRQRMMEEADRVDGDQMILLPFLRSINCEGDLNLPDDSRLDSGSALPGPHAGRLTPRPDVKNVQ